MKKYSADLDVVDLGPVVEAETHAETILERLLAPELEAQRHLRQRRTDLHAWASEAMQCSRAVGYRLMETPGEHRRGLGSLVVTHLGNVLHEAVGRALQRAYAGTTLEVVWDRGPLSGRADGLYPQVDYAAKREVNVVVETKTMTGAKFDFYSRRVETPDPAHVMQAQLSALALDGDYVHMIYVNRHAHSDLRAVAEWTLPVDKTAAELEFSRLSHVVEAVKRGDVPAPVVDGEVITNPLQRNLPCKWCPYLQTCAAAGPGGPDPMLTLGAPSYKHTAKGWSMGSGPEFVSVGPDGVATGAGDLV